VTARNRVQNSYNLLNELVTEIPFTTLQDSLFQELISISYVIEKEAKYFVGMSSRYFLRFNKLDKNNVMKSDSAMNGYILLPVFVE
ncbi:MAG: hypothetical protein K8R68_11130, partial [Bacteroidales bacterium]|nr:hypothetical protein [Bacteroidales bacterium]